MSTFTPTGEELLKLLTAARDGDVATLEYLIKEKHYNINTRDPKRYGQTPLLVSCRNGKLTAAKKLIDMGADINDVDESGCTALHCAAISSSCDLVKMLIDLGLDIRTVNGHGWTALHHAAYSGSCDLVKMLTDLGLDVHTVENSGYTPLHIAALNDKSELVWSLIHDHQVDISQYGQGTKDEIDRLLKEEDTRRQVKAKQESNDVVSDDIVHDGLSHKAVNEAFLDSTMPSPDVRVAMLGTEGSGKTCLGDTLTGQEFKDTSPTEGADQMEVVVKTAVDWTVLSKEEMIENLQQQVLQESKHQAEQKDKPTYEEDSSTSAPKPAPLAPSAPLPMSKLKPELPMLELPRGDKMYFLTIEEFKQLPSFLEKYDPHRRYLNVWDYAGQQVFQHTHGLFISEEVVCLIVFDASKLLDEVPERRYEGDTSPARSSLDSICYWMNLISCHVSRKSSSDSDLSEFFPTFVLVGTHIDLLHPDIDKAYKIAWDRCVPILNERIAGKPFAKHIAGSKNHRLFAPGSPSIFFLSNCFRNREVVVQLQKIIIQASPQKLRPTRLVEMERKLILLSHKEKLSVINVAQIQEVAKSCGLPTSDHEVLEVLKFFHQKGTLLYFDQVPALSDVVILCPQWLAKLLTYVLTNLICKPAGPPLAQYAEERNKKGLLRQELLDCCVERFLQDEVTKGHKALKFTADDLVDLLTKFKLVVDVTNTSIATKMSTAPEGRLFVVPHLLPVEPFKEATGPCYKVFYKFVGGFIPDSLVDQLIVKSAEWNKKNNFDFLKLAYQWVMMELGDYQSYHLRPLHKEDCIELTIVRDPKMPQEEETTASSTINELVVDVKTVIDDLMRETMTATFEKFPVQCYLKCPECHEAHVSLEKICRKCSDICHKTNQYFDMTSYHQVFRLKQLTSGGLHMSPNLTQDKLVTMDAVVVIAPMIAMHWDDIGYRLKLQEHDVELIETETRGDLTKACKKMLRKWLRSTDSRGPKTWKTVVDVLLELKIDCNSVIATLEKEAVQS